jgi:hypothetical protein
MMLEVRLLMLVMTVMDMVFKQDKMQTSLTLCAILTGTLTEQSCCAKKWSIE